MQEIMSWFSTWFMTSLVEHVLIKSFHFSFHASISTLSDWWIIECESSKKCLYNNLLWLTSMLVCEFLTRHNNNAHSLWVTVLTSKAKWCPDKYLFRLKRCSIGSLFILPVSTCTKMLLFNKHYIWSEKARKAWENSKKVSSEGSPNNAFIPVLFFLTLHSLLFLALLSS